MEPLPFDPPFHPNRNPGLRATAAALRALIARIRSERLIEKATRLDEMSRRRREAAERLLTAALLADPLAN